MKDLKYLKQLQRSAEADVARAEIRLLAVDEAIDKFNSTRRMTPQTRGLFRRNNKKP